MPALPPELREFIESGRLAHPSTINPDGSPQVTLVWIGLDGGDPVSTTSGGRQTQKLRREPRVALSFDLLREPGVWSILMQSSMHGRR